MGDVSLWTFINELVTCRVPMLNASGPESLAALLAKFDPEAYVQPSPKKLRQWDITITDAGKDVLAGKKDWIQLNGIDRWLGGVHLKGSEAQWRWDEEREVLVEWTR